MDMPKGRIIKTGAEKVAFRYRGILGKRVLGIRVRAEQRKAVACRRKALQRSPLIRVRSKSIAVYRDPKLGIFKRFYFLMRENTYVIRKSQFL